MLKQEPIDALLLTVGSMYSITNLDNLYGVILLVLQIVWLLVKLILKIISIVKSKGVEGITENDVKSIIERINEIKHTVEVNGEHKKDE